MSPTSQQFEDLTPDELNRRAAQDGLAVLAVGAAEPHGRHLPLGTDSHIAAAVADRLGEEAGGVVFPVVRYGTVQVSYDLRSMPGTLSLHPDVLKALIVGIGTEIGRNGFRALVIVNGHLPNSPVLNLASFEIKDRCGLEVGILEWWAAARVIVSETKGTPRGTHGDEIETSIAMAAGVEPLVPLEQALDMGELQTHVDADRFSLYELGITYTRDLAGEGWVSSLGNMGSPRLASPEVGGAIIDETVRVGRRLAATLLSSAG